MTNKQMNNGYLKSRNEMLKAIEKFEMMLNNEKFVLEGYESGELAVDANGRNSKGEFVNLNQMRSNIAELEAYVSKVREAFSSLSISASIYE